MTRENLEAQLHELHAARDLAGTATMAVREYGPEILGYLYAVARDEQRASDAFATFLEDVWRGLPTFAWQSSLRTWLYAVARNALFRELREQARARRGLPLSQVPELAEIAERTRTTTLPFLRTEIRDRARQLRELLDPEEQTLLILRVDRQMSWHEIAVILHGEEAANLPRRVAALRKRYERLLIKLREQCKR